MSPEASAATRVASLPIGVKMTSVTLLSILSQYAGLTTSSVRTPGWRERSMNGPVPLALSVAAFSLPLRTSTGPVALFFSHHARLMM